MRGWFDKPVLSLLKGLPRTVCVLLRSSWACRRTGPSGS